MLKLKLTPIWLFAFLLLHFASCTPTESITEPEDETVTTIAPEETIDRTFTYAGKPEALEYPNPINILYNEGYVSGYDEIRGTPAWVAYRVFHVDEYFSNPRPSRFLIDDRTQNRVSHDDYTHSGYDRGHMAPNFAIVSRFGADAQRETFLMTNIIPQRPSLNRQWWQRLERLIARDYSERYDEVWVLTGPIFKDTGNWLNDKVKVPTHNYKIIKTEKNGDLHMKAFIVHQEVGSSEPYEPYFTTVRHLEDLTGFNFNPLLDKTFADSVENIQASTMW